MEITERDLEGVNTFNVKYRIEDGCIEIDHDSVRIYINKRPVYCDRGRFGICIDNLENKLPVVDWADMFPRYFFKLENAFDELNSWISFNAAKR